MNKNPDGSLLSKDDLIAIAVGAGHNEAELRASLGSVHGGGAVRSFLLDLTCKARLALMWEGKLKFDTRHTWVPKAEVIPDPDVVRFLTERR